MEKPFEKKTELREYHLFFNESLVLLKTEIVPVRPNLGDFSSFHTSILNAKHTVYFYFYVFCKSNFFEKSAE